MRPESRPVMAGHLAKASDVAELNPTDEKARQQWIALVDVKETPHEVTILVDLPGVDEDEILIEAKNGTVYVSAPRDFDHDNEDAEDYTRLDRPYGEFHCEVPLPELAAPDEMTAKYRRGVLKVNVPCRRRL